MQLDRIVSSLSRVRGVKAIALGGSQSRGEADQESDYDIGVYYDGDVLDTAALGQCLKELDDGHKDDLLHPPGQWGPWINGGAWLTVDNTPVDILLRDIKRVEEVLRDCTKGRLTIDYQSGHPFGFVNTIYAAETHYCKPLWQDEARELDRLKALLHAEGEYPPLMRTATIGRFLWEAWFSLACGRKAAFKGDTHYAMGSVFRAVCSWLQVLNAVNNRYLMNEKGALKWVDGLTIKPREMTSRVCSVYTLMAAGKADEAYRLLDELHSEIAGLSGETVTDRIR
ncbi:MAG TPA: nucleotidyltransferase domain-containing protein [Thermoclostridium caenicola]|nr:nucleotidyltransferase domain-containing protein [Thermoclostridium caenicola]